MATDFDEAQLQKLVADFLEGSPLTPAERVEVARIAKGFTCAQSAGAAGVALETIRARRKRIYKKLDVSGGHAIIAELLAKALGRMAA